MWLAVTETRGLQLHLGHWYAHTQLTANRKVWQPQVRKDVLPRAVSRVSIQSSTAWQLGLGKLLAKGKENLDSIRLLQGLKHPLQDCWSQPHERDEECSPLESVAIEWCCMVASGKGLFLSLLCLEPQDSGRADVLELFLILLEEHPPDNIEDDITCSSL